MKRTELLSSVARQALEQYNADLASGSEPVYPQWAKDLQLLLSAYEQMASALRRIIDTKPAYGLNPNTVVGSPHAIGWNVHDIARVSLAAAEAA